MPTYIDTPIYEAEPEHQVSEELRLNSTGSDTLHWVTGLFYSTLNSAFVERQNAPYIAQLSETLSPPMDNPTGLTFGINNLYEITQKAAFADASWQFVPTFKVEGGLRWFRYDTSAFNNEWGYFFTPQAAPLANPPGNFASASGVIPRADIAWLPNHNLTTYLSVSKGFRPGGANMTIPLVACPEGGPESFDSDTGLGLRGRREGDARPEPHQAECRYLLHQVGQSAADGAALLRYGVHHQRRRWPQLWTRGRLRREDHRRLDVLRCPVPTPGPISPTSIQPT